jgi:hypothetical protein
MAHSFVFAPPSAKADATRTNEFGANSKSPLKWTEYNHAVLFRELLLLARWRSLSERNTYSSGWCWNEANQLSLTRTHVNLPSLPEHERSLFNRFYRQIFNLSSKPHGNITIIIIHPF